MVSVPRLRRSDDDGEWHDLEAALSVAYAALTDAQTLWRRTAPTRRASGQGLDLADALAIVLTILDAYLDPPEHDVIAELLDPEGASDEAES